MSITRDSQVISLRHEPYGEQHPYEPLPFERSPRDPSAGEEVKLGIVTSLESAAKTVCCQWQIEGSSAIYKKEAVKTESENKGDCWMVKLPAFDGGQKVRYRFFAKNAEETIESPEF